MVALERLKREHRATARSSSCVGSGMVALERLKLQLREPVRIRVSAPEEEWSRSSDGLKLDSSIAGLSAPVGRGMVALERLIHPLFGLQVSQCLVGRGMVAFERLKPLRARENRGPAFCRKRNGRA